MSMPQETILQENPGLGKVISYRGLVVSCKSLFECPFHLSSTTSASTTIIQAPPVQAFLKCQDEVTNTTQCGISTLRVSAHVSTSLNWVSSSDSHLDCMRHMLSALFS